MDWARRLYAHVAERVGTDVDVAELEAQFDFMWSPVPMDEVRSSDPYSSRVLEDGVKGSFAGLLAELDRVCATLPGLNPGELGVNHEVTQARNGMWHRVGRALCDPRCTQEDLERVTHEVYVEVVTAAHARAMHRLHSQVEGMRALQRLCAAVGEGRDISESLECDMEHLCTVLTTPPPSLAHELTRMGVPLVALRDLLRLRLGEMGSGAKLDGPISRGPSPSRVTAGTRAAWRCEPPPQQQHRGGSVPPMRANTPADFAPKAGASPSKLTRRGSAGTYPSSSSIVPQLIPQLPSPTREEAEAEVTLAL